MVSKRSVERHFHSGAGRGGRLSPATRVRKLPISNAWDSMSAEQCLRGPKGSILRRFSDNAGIRILAWSTRILLSARLLPRLPEELFAPNVLLVGPSPAVARTGLRCLSPNYMRVDLDRAESFGFLGFDFRRLRSMKRQVWRAHYTPKVKKRTALLRKLKDVFRRYQSQPVDRVVQLINPVLRGWVNYFAVGHSSECFSFIKDWVEKKIRRHMGRSRNRRGFGWKRWSRRWLYEELKLFNGYRVRRASELKALPA